MIPPRPGPRPFCEASKPLRDAFDHWLARVERLGIEVGEPDRFVIGLIASREVRLEELGRELKRERDSARRLRLVAAERLAAQDMAKALDQAERVFGAAVGEAPEAVEAEATGTEGRVLAFTPASHGLSPTGARILAVLQRVGRPVSKAALRRSVRGNQGAFLDGLREAIAAGAVLRRGLGKKGRPYSFEAAR